MGGCIHIDHIVPVRQGGTHADDNLATSCRGCNQAKGNRTPEQWAGEDRRLDRLYGATVTEWADSL